MQTYLKSNHRKLEALAHRMGMRLDGIKEDRLIAGTMLMARRDAREPLLNLSLTAEDFEVEARQLDGTTAHALERALTYSAKAVEMEVFSVESDDSKKERPWVKTQMQISDLLNEVERKNVASY